MLCARCSKKKGEDGAEEDIEVQMIAQKTISGRLTRYKCPKCTGSFKQQRPVVKVLEVTPDNEEVEPDKLPDETSKPKLVVNPGNDIAKAR